MLMTYFVICSIIKVTEPFMKIDYFKLIWQKFAIRIIKHLINYTDD